MIKTYMQIAGYPGRSQVRGLESYYDVHSFAWHEASATSTGGGGGGSGKPISSEVHIMLDIGLGSTKMFADACAGRHFQSVSLIGVRSNSSKILVLEEYQFSDARFDYFGFTDISGANAGLCELHMVFRRLTMITRHQNAAGAIQSETGTFDFSTNAP